MAGIYIHIPFCKQACHYCDFHFSTGMAKKEAMVKAICLEIEMRKETFAKDEIQTIYFGGGTPSVLSIDELQSILNAVKRNYVLVKNPEITLEANPDDLSKQMLLQLSKSTINRLSIGVQSFFDQDLQLMNRAHNAKEAEECIREATKYFENISIDLIYGIPNLDHKRWLQNIKKALSFNISHISTYALTVEPKTALKKFIEEGKVPEVDDSLAQEQFYMLAEHLEGEGFIHYEISNFGKLGYFSENNTAYWKGKKYLGVGPSAHSYDGVSRSWNVRNNAKYIRAINEDILPQETEILSKRDRYNEYIMTGLRTIWGISVLFIKEEYGIEYQDHLMQQVKKYIHEELLFLNNDTLLVTKKGKFLVDGIAADLFLLNLKDRME